MDTTKYLHFEELSEFVEINIATNNGAMESYHSQAHNRDRKNLNTQGYELLWKHFSMTVIQGYR